MVCLCLSQGQAVNLDALVGAILAGMLILLLGVVFVSGVILHFMLWLSSGIINLGLGASKDRHKSIPR